MLRTTRGFTLIEMLVVIVIIGILALIAIPSFTVARYKAYNATAESAGKSAKLCEDVYFQEHQDSNYPYTSRLSDLLVHDRNVTGDGGVTFIFTYTGDTNFTFSTSHVRGDKKYLYSDH